MSKSCNKFLLYKFYYIKVAVNSILNVPMAIVSTWVQCAMVLKIA